jgi:hypothetical protein
MTKENQGAMLPKTSETNHGICLRGVGSNNTEEHHWIGEGTTKGSEICNGDYKTTSSVRSMFEHLEWQTLEERRKRANVIILYRIIHQVVATPAQPYLIPRGVASTTSGHCQRYQLPYWRLLCHQQTFFPSTIRLWNELPAEAVSASTV